MIVGVGGLGCSSDVSSERVSVPKVTLLVVDDEPLSLAIVSLDVPSIGRDLATLAIGICSGLTSGSTFTGVLTAKSIRFGIETS